MAKKTTSSNSSGSNSPLNDSVVGTSGPDTIATGNGHDTVAAGGGNDSISGQNGKDQLSGGSGADTIKGNNGKDLILGDGKPEYVSGTLSFGDASTWTGLSADKLTLEGPGLTVQAQGGQLAQFRNALSINSPNDGAAEAWTFEIDAWNNTQEGVKLSFEQPQATVSLTLQQLYKEWIWLVEPEKADVTLYFSDGTSVKQTVLASATGGAGELIVTLDGSITGGRMITDILLQPSLDLPSLPPGQPRPPSANFNRPFSEFTLKAVTYTHDANEDPGNNDKLVGNNGADTLYGGLGNDTMYGLNGPDLFYGGAGNNEMTGGNGPDTFVFDYSSKGVNLITDFKVQTDHLKFEQGVTVVGKSYSGGATTLDLSNGGDVVLVGVKVSDWHDLL